MVKKVDVNGLINCFKQAVDHKDVLEKSLRWQKLYKPTDSLEKSKRKKKMVSLCLTANVPNMSGTISMSTILLTFCLKLKSLRGSILPGKKG